MFGKKKETKEEKFETLVARAGLTGLLNEDSSKLFQAVQDSKRGLAAQEFGSLTASERNCLRTIVSQNETIRKQNDMIIQFLAQIANNTKGE